jgi:hypothetical protein
LQPFGHETGNVHIESSRPQKDLDVACSAQSLITLGAVSGYIEKVSLLPPDNIVLKLV